MTLGAFNTLVDNVRLRFYTKWGRQETLKIGLRAENINLSSRGITSIDLTPLQYCSKIRYINLSDNDLTQIDLNPLCSIQNFFKLNLANNPLELLNVTPLLFCNNLTHLLGCENLTYLIDPHGQFALGNYAILQSTSRLKLYKSYDDLVRVQNWRSVLSHTTEFFRLLPQRHWFAAQMGFLTGLGFPDIAAYDGNPLNLLTHIPPKMSYKCAKVAIQEETISLLKNQIESGGSTHFLDVEKITISPAAILIPSIIENRRKEMENLRIERINGKVDGRIFYFTHYGRQILAQLGYRPIATQSISLDDVLQAIEQTGFSPDIVDLECEPTRHSWERFSEGLTDFLEHYARGSSFVIDIVNRPWKVGSLMPIQSSN